MPLALWLIAEYTANWTDVYENKYESWIQNFPSKCRYVSTIPDRSALQKAAVLIGFLGMCMFD